MKHRLIFVTALALISAAALSARGTAKEKERRSSAPIELEIPAGTKVTAEGAVVRNDGAARELRIEAPATLRLGNGMTLRSKQALWVLPNSGANSSTLIRIGAAK